MKHLLFRNIVTVGFLVTSIMSISLPSFADTQMQMYEKIKREEREERIGGSGSINPIYQYERERKMVESILKQQGRKYEVVDSSTLKVTVLVEYEGNRNQVVFIKHTGSYRMKITNIYSIGYEYQGFISPRISEKILVDSSSEEIGSWGLGPLRRDMPRNVVFTAQMIGDSTPEELAMAIDLVARVADKMEKQLISTDKF